MGDKTDKKRRRKNQNLFYYENKPNGVVENGTTP